MKPIMIEKAQLDNLIYKIIYFQQPVQPFLLICLISIHRTKGVLF